MGPSDSQVCLFVGPGRVAAPALYYTMHGSHACACNRTTAGPPSRGAFVQMWAFADQQVSKGAPAAVRDRIGRAGAVIANNSFNIYDGTVTRSIGRGLFPAAAFINHSCDPNCAVSFHGASAFGSSVSHPMRALSPHRSLCTEALPSLTRLHGADLLCGRSSELHTSALYLLPEVASL